MEGLQQSPPVLLGLAEGAGPWSFLLPPHPLCPARTKSCLGEVFSPSTSHRQLALAARCRCHLSNRLMGAIWSERRGWLCLPPPVLAGSPGGVLSSDRNSRRQRDLLFALSWFRGLRLHPALPGESLWAIGGDGGFCGTCGTFAQDEGVHQTWSPRLFPNILSPNTRRKNTLSVFAAAFGRWVISAFPPPLPFSFVLLLKK